MELETDMYVADIHVRECIGGFINFEEKPETLFGLRPVTIGCKYKWKYLLYILCFFFSSLRMLNSLFY